MDNQIEVGVMVSAGQGKFPNFVNMKVTAPDLKTAEKLAEIEAEKQGYIVIARGVPVKNVDKELYEKYKDGVPGTVIRAPKVYTIEKARELATMMSRWENEGWNYKIETIDHEYALIGVYEKGGEFVAYWTI